MEKYNILYLIQRLISQHIVQGQVPNVDRSRTKIMSGQNCYELKWGDIVNEKTLFEIPIYAMSEKEFNNRWDKKKSKFMISGHTEKSAEMCIKSIYFPGTIWKYNQIVGFIIVSVTRQDVIFEIFCSMDKKFHADSKTKHFIQYFSSLANHFSACNKTEEFIKQKIIEMLKRIEKYDINHKFYIDYSTFNNIFNFVNIRQIMKTL